MQVYTRMAKRLVVAGMHPAKAALHVTQAYRLSMLHMEAIYEAICQ